MKSDKRLDEEIKAVAKLWDDPNAGIEGGSRESLAFSLVYDTLRWARGYREEFPLVRLQKLLVDERPERWEPSAKVRAEKAMQRIRDQITRERKVG